ncbi:MAG: GH92 family glycosyl hydrolase [Rubrivivax sp.]|nr:GH92 family glycosyl hydrolase [Rubrivivax sp.]
MCADPWRALAAGALCFALLQPALAPAAPAADVLRHVDPFIGTDGTGHVTPAAAVPFGMVMPGPDHADRGWSFSSGYQWKARRTLGFSNTHISGAGIPELGDVLLMPSAGLRWTAASADFSAAHDKRSERARPGFYGVSLPSHGVQVALTTTPRVALHRYRFTRPGAVQVLLDLQHGLHFIEGPRVTAAQVQQDLPRGEITGTVHAKNWVEREASFIVRFSQPILRATALPAKAGEKAPRLLLDFGTLPGRELQVRVALSTVDVEGARRNLAQAEACSFDQVRADATAAWARLLGRLQIEADSRTQRIVYSALYRALLHPSDIADADGRVRGPRGEVMQAPGGRYHSTLSLWDTFRAVHPLYTLLVPQAVPAMVDSMLAHHAQMGFLPLWTAWGRETFTMIGNPALPVLAEAVVKDLVAPERRPAVLKAMVETSTRSRPDAPAWAQRDWTLYEQFGYLPFDLYGQQGQTESVSKALEYGIGDDAVARVARALGDLALADRFARRAGGWRQLWDERLGTVRGKDSAGRWREPFDPAEATSPMNNPGDFTEANAWQYSLAPALHDAQGLRDRVGGPRALGDWLDAFLARPMPKADKHLGQEALVGQLAHGNEPGHHVPWLYAYTDRPHKGPELVRRIAREFYGTGPGGLIGNDDAGQMGAWFVFAALGFYPVMPASGRYVAGEPLVRRATLTRPDGTRLEIVPSPRPGVRLDGRETDPTALPHAALMHARRLELGPMRAPTQAASR